MNFRNAKCVFFVETLPRTGSSYICDALSALGCGTGNQDLMVGANVPPSKFSSGYFELSPLLEWHKRTQVGRFEILDAPPRLDDLVRLAPAQEAAFIAAIESSFSEAQGSILVMKSFHFLTSWVFKSLFPNIPQARIYVSRNRTSQVNSIRKLIASSGGRVPNFPRTFFALLRWQRFGRRIFDPECPHIVLSYERLPNLNIEELLWFAEKASVSTEAVDKAFRDRFLKPSS